MRNEVPRELGRKAMCTGRGQMRDVQLMKDAIGPMDATRMLQYVHYSISLHFHSRPHSNAPLHN